MSDPMTDFQARLASAVQAYLDRPELKAPPAAVVADVVGRPIRWRHAMPRWLAASTAASVLLVVGLVAILVGPGLFDDDRFGIGASPSPGSPTPSASPRPSSAEPIDGSPLAVRPLWTRAYVLDGLSFELHAVAIEGLAEPGFQGWRILDDQTLILNYRESARSTGPPAEPDAASVWLADLDEQRLTSVHPDGPILDVDASAEQVLLWEPGALTIIDRTGAELARLALAFPTGVFLADGSVVASTSGSIGLWRPNDRGYARSRLPDMGAHRYGFSAVGDGVAFFGLSFDGPSRSALLDPNDWRRRGPEWQTADSWSVAVSPDGTRFVVAVGRDDGGDRLELRDVATGEVVAVNDVPSDAAVTGLAWPTEDLIVAIRATDAPRSFGQPELYLAGEFSRAPLAIEPFAEISTAWSPPARGSTLLSVDGRGDLVVITVMQMDR